MGLGLMTDEREQDHYATLEVAPDADDETIHQAYRALARRYHPDVAGTGSLAHMQQLNLAYTTLSNPERRRLYDLQRGLLPVESATPPASERPPAPPHPTHQQSASDRAPRQGSVAASAGPFSRAQLLDAGESVPMAGLAFSGDGRRMLVGALDGHVGLWDVAATHQVARLAFGTLSGSVGVLQAVRLAPSGAIALAWGFQCGMHVWDVASQRTLWNSSINGPSGLLDAVVGDDPALITLALPHAPLALADDSPFRWAHEGRAGTAVLARPARGPVDPAWATPLVCAETGTRSHVSGADGDPWRIQQRVLSSDGRLLCTYSASHAERRNKARVLHLWELDHRSLLGSTQARRTVEIAAAADDLHFPLAATPDLAWVAMGYQGRNVRVYRLRSGERRTVTTGPLFDDARLLLTPRATYLALARGAALDLYETSSGQRVQQVRFAAEVASLGCTLGAGSLQLAIGLSNGLVEVWRDTRSA